MFLHILKTVPGIIHSEIIESWNLHHDKITLDTNWGDFIDICGLDAAITNEWEEHGGVYVYLMLYWKRKAFPPGMNYIAALTQDYLIGRGIRYVSFEDIKRTAKLAVKYSRRYLHAHALNDTQHYGETLNISMSDIKTEHTPLMVLFDNKRDLIELDIMDYYFTVKSMARRNTRPATADYLKSIRALEIDMMSKLWNYHEKILPWKQFNPTKYNVPLSHVPDFKRYYETLRNRNKYSSLKESKHEHIK